MVFFFLGIILGIFASLKLSYITTHYLNEWFTISEQWLPIISFGLSFLLVFLAARFIANLLEGVLKLVMLNFFNKIAGGILGATISFIVLSIGIWYVSNMNVLPENYRQDSKIYETSMQFAPLFIEKTSEFIPYMKNLFESLQEMFIDFDEKHMIIEE